MQKDNTYQTNHPENDVENLTDKMISACVKLGLRIGEGIGIRTNQFLFDERAFVVDGFWKVIQPAADAANELFK